MWLVLLGMVAEIDEGSLEEEELCEEGMREGRSTVQQKDRTAQRC